MLYLYGTKKFYATTLSIKVEMSTRLKVGWLYQLYSFIYCIWHVKAKCEAFYFSHSLNVSLYIYPFHKVRDNKRIAFLSMKLTHDTFLDLCIRHYKVPCGTLPYIVLSTIDLGNHNLFDLSIPLLKVPSLAKSTANLTFVKKLLLNI